MKTTNEFCQTEYGQKLYKISMNAGFTCPNRDGKLGKRGCIFCSEGGSGDFSVPYNDEEAIEKEKEKLSRKYHGDKYIAYFQSFSNTYVPDGDVDRLRNIYLTTINRKDVAVLSIATRPDCLTEEIYELLKELNSIKPVWVELGLQTTRKESVDYIRRGYDTKVYDEAIKRLNEIGIHTITHVILFLPNETIDDMKRTVQHVVELGSKGIKLQLLHVLKNTDLAIEYEKNSFKLPTLDEYTKALKACIDLLPENMVVHRLTGDPPKKLLVEPKWAANKKVVLNAVKDVLAPQEPYYVYILMCEDGSLYTGSTNDIKLRFNKHQSGKGAKYTRSHPPVEIVYQEEFPSKRKALQREIEIKKMSRSKKLELVRLNEKMGN